MIYVVHNKEYFDSKYQFNIVEPFSGNVKYVTVHVKDFDHYIKRLTDISNLLT